MERVVFNAITKQSVLEAMKHPREIDGAPLSQEGAIVRCL